MSKPCYLTAMPSEIKVHIIAYLDARGRLSLRKCTRDFRSLIDESPFHYNTLSIEMTKNVISLDTIDQYEEYVQVDYADVRRLRWNFPVHPVTMFSRNGDFIQRALRDLKTFIKSEKVTIELLMFAIKLRDRDMTNEIKQIYEMFMNGLKNMLSNLGHLIHVERVLVQLRDDSKCMLCLLPYMKPGVLNSISVMASEPNGQQISIGDVVQLEQWKQAAEFVSEYVTVNVPVRHLTNFKRVVITIARLSQDDGALLLEHFKTVALGTSFNFSCAAMANLNNVMKRTSNLSVAMAAAGRPGRTTHLFRFPGTGELLVVHVASNSLEMARESEGGEL